MRTTALTNVLAHAALVAACSEAPSSVEEGPISHGPSASLAITWAEFRSSVYREPGPNGKFIVDGDIPLADEAALRAYYDAAGTAPGALTISRVNGVDERWPFPQQFALTYCVGNSLGTNKAAAVAAIQQAADAWERIVAVDFIYVASQDSSCTSSNGNVLFDVNLAPANAPYTARAFFPHEPRSSRNLLINSVAFGAMSNGKDLQGVMMHELGHALGYRHEHIRRSSPCTSELVGDVRYATAYDPNSVMHYPECRTPIGGGYRISPLDYAGAVGHYGLSPALLALL